MSGQPVELKLSTPYLGKDDVTWYIVCKIKLGRGYSIHWDTVPVSPEYWSDMEGKKNRTKQGLAGYMPQAKFIKLIKNTP